MKIRSRLNAKGLYRIMGAGILTCIILFLPEALLGIREVTRWNILVLAAVLVLFAGINFLPARGRILCLVTVFIGLGVSMTVIGMDACVSFLRAYVRWCGGSRIAQTEWLTGCQLVQTAVIAAVCYLIQILLEKFWAFKIGLACVCAAALLVCLFTQAALTHFSMAFLVLYIVLVYVEWMQKHWKKSRSGGLEEHIVWLSPFLAVYLIFLSLTPAPETPYDWQWVKDIYHRARENFLIVTQNILRGGREDFGIGLSGFSEDGELGEGFRENSREVMRVQGQGSLLTNIYLIGKVYDTFDGKQWLQEYHDSEKERFIDTMETLYAVRRLDGRYLSDYICETDLKIRYEFFNTKYVFAPLKSEVIKTGGFGLEYSFEGGDLLLENQKGYGTEYDVTYYQLNVGQELFDRLLTARQEQDEGLWDLLAGQYAKDTNQRITLEMVDAHRQKIYDNYMEEITLSGEVEDYLERITKDAQNGLEKLQAIERELASFTYTRTPGKLPEDITDAEEFLDYFLLESREGYCTYFATAFALLARAEGFPARYVNGFCVPAGEGEVTVLSNMSHSWPEVYMEGVGWIPFEPTPGYEGLRYTPWAVRERGDTSFYEEEEEEEDLDGDELVAANHNKEEEEQEQVFEDAEAVRRLRRLVGFGIPAILAGYVIVLAADNMLSRYRYHKMTPEGKLRVEVRRNLRLLSWLGLAREEQETLQELQERGSHMLGVTSLNFIEEYENVVYGGKAADDKMLERVRKERERLLELTGKEKRFAHTYYKMRLFLVRYR